MASPMRKERSSLVKRLLISKASKVSKADVDQNRKSEASKNKPKTTVKAVGLGRKRRGSATKHSKEPTISTAEEKKKDDWEVVEEDDKSDDADKKAVKFDPDLDTRDDKPSEEAPASSPLDKAADVADKSMLFIGENVHKVVLSTIKVLNKKD